MLKILLKAAVLVFIILSVYFIVHPSACSNLMLGRVTNPADNQPAVQEPAGTHGNLFTPAADRPLEGYTPAQKTGEEENELLQGDLPLLDEPAGQEPAAVNSSAEQTAQTAAPYSQEDIDYAIARRYVELEQEYARLNKIGKDTEKYIHSLITSVTGAEANIRLKDAKVGVEGLELKSVLENRFDKR